MAFLLTNRQGYKRCRKNCGIARKLCATVIALWGSLGYNTVKEHSLVLYMSKRLLSFCVRRGSCACPPTSGVLSANMYLPEIHVCTGVLDMSTACPILMQKNNNIIIILKSIVHLNNCKGILVHISFFKLVH